MFTTQMFTKQNTKQKVYKTKQKFTNTLCLQNKIQYNKFTSTLCLHNKTNVYNTNVYKTKVYNTNVYKTKQSKTNFFTDRLYLQNKHVMFIKQMFYIQFILTKQKQTKVYKRMFIKQNNVLTSFHFVTFHCFITLDRRCFHKFN